MERQTRHYPDRQQDDNGVKLCPYHPLIRKARVDLVDDFQYGQDYRLSRSNTPCPSMTHCSSTSASSSIIACIHGADAGQCHACQGLPDSENYGYQPFDSPRTHLVLLPPQRKEERLFSDQFLVKRPEFSVIDDNGPGNDDHRFRPVKGTIACDGLIHAIHDHEDSSNNRNRPRSNPFHGIVASAASRDSQLTLYQGATIDENSESDAGDEDEEADEDEDGEDDWSGQEDNLEAKLLEALRHDPELAAYLIPHLYKIFHSNISKKVDPWLRHGVATCSPGGGTTSSGKTPSTNAGTDTSNTSANKRPRGLGPVNHDQEGEGDDEDDGDEDDDNREPKRLKDNPDNGGSAQHLRLACPFYKLDPSKYSIQHEAVENGKKSDYRVCAGPGFISITRLKEHLKRKHYPVQCERCYHIFQGGPDRAARARELENHRQHPHPCERRDASLKEGISDAQWASLDSKKKNQGSTNIEKWNEIWMILFPGKPTPKTPWYDQSSKNMDMPPPSEGSSEFLDLFRNILGHQISQQNIRLEEGMDVRVLNAAKTAFEVWSRVYRSDTSFSSTNSSSLLSHQQTSSLGGPWQHIISPRTTRRDRLSTTTPSTGVQSQVFSMDIAGSPTASSMMSPQRSQRQSVVHGMVHNFMAAQPSYNPHGIGASISAEQNGHAAFPVDNINTFVGVPFDDNQGTEQPFDMNYDSPGAGFTNGGFTAAELNRAAAFANPTGGINPNLISSPGSPLHQNLAAMHQNNWSHQFSSPRQQPYHGGQP